MALKNMFDPQTHVQLNVPNRPDPWLIDVQGLITLAVVVMVVLKPV